MNLKTQGKSPENNFTKFINSLKKWMCYDPPISTLGNINVYEQRSSLKDAHQRIIIIKIWKQSKSSKIRLSKLSFTLDRVYLKMSGRRYSEMERYSKYMSKKSSLYKSMVEQPHFIKSQNKLEKLL